MIWFKLGIKNKWVVIKITLIIYLIDTEIWWAKTHTSPQIKPIPNPNCLHIDTFKPETKILVTHLGES
jgi:hypothetical protein